MEKFYNELEDIYSELVYLRRDFHMYPELSHKEENTPEKIADFYKKLGLEVKKNVGGRGVVAKINNNSNKTVAFRADFDALPIQEENTVDYKSKIPGVMHACGHDIHTAALLGVAKVLSQNASIINANVVFIHQFAEEVIPGGAKFMIEDGCLDNVDVIYGAHVDSTIPLGVVGVLSGPAMANGDTFEIKIQGKGGHAASPHQTVDPILVGAQMVLNLQQIISRKIDPIESAVVSVTTFNAGDSFNVIPDRALIRGTVRTFSDEVQDQIESSIKKIALHTSEAFNSSIEFDYVRGYPVVNNNEKETKRVEKIAKNMFGANSVSQLRPQMGMEDFGYYLKEKPGTFFWVGGALSDKEDIFPHHHPRFNVDEKSMLFIGKLFISTLFDYMNEDKVS